MSFVPGQGLTCPRSKPSPIKIDTSIRALEPQSKVTSTSSWWSVSDVQSKAIVFGDAQCSECQRMTWKVTSKLPWSFGWNLLSKLLLRLPPSSWPPLSPPLLLCLPTSSALFLPAPPTPTIPFLGSAELVLKVFNIEISGVAIQLNLDELPCQVQGRSGRLVLTFGQVRASGWIRSTLEANRFLIVRLLKSQTHSQRHPSDFRSKRVEVPAGDLDSHQLAW